MQFNISLVLLAVLDREADSSHLVLAKADNFDYIAQSQNVLYAVDTLFCDLGNVNHSLFARCKLKECAELFDADNFTGKVVSIKEFGAFLEFAPGKEGMVHISKIAKERINRVEDVLTLGDVVKVVCLGKDKMGRISFSIKDCKEN